MNLKSFFCYPVYPEAGLVSRWIGNPAFPKAGLTESKKDLGE